MRLHALKGWTVMHDANSALKSLSILIHSEKCHTNMFREFYNVISKFADDKILLLLVRVVRLISTVHITVLSELLMCVLLSVTDLRV